MGVIFLWGSISMPSYIWKRRKGKCGFASHVKKRREPHHQSIITLFCHSTKAPAHLTLPAFEHSVWYIAFLFFCRFFPLRIFQLADESPQMSTVIQKIWMIQCVWFYYALELKINSKHLIAYLIDWKLYLCRSWS